MKTADPNEPKLVEPQSTKPLTNRLKLSVLMLVYEHQEFVSQAISSVLSQVCDFQFELIIINDCSSDNSGEICQDYAARHADCIKYINNKTNLGMHASFSKLWSTSQADLVAFCEGDDYWLDDTKLQAQVDCLEKNSDWALCGAKAQIVKRSTDNTWLVAGELKPPNLKPQYRFDELIRSYCFHFSTVMLRKSAVVFPAWFDSVYCVDRPIYLLAAEHGQAGYLDKVVSAYRIHSGGNWSTCSNSVKAKQSSDLFRKLAGHFDESYRVSFELSLFDILQSYVAIEMQERRYATARKLFVRAFGEVSFRNKFRCLRKHYRTAALLLVKR